MIRLDNIDRTRKHSVWVEDQEYFIHTSFPHWLAFEKKLEGIDNNSDYSEFDYLYKTIASNGVFYGRPEDKLAGLVQLVEFYKEPFNTVLPRDVGDNLNIKAIDWIIDSEYINAAFMSQYRINLITNDLHFHEFIYLFRSLKGHVINDIMAMRSWVQPKEHRTHKALQEAINKESLQNRKRWELLTEKKEPFVMR